MTKVLVTGGAGFIGSNLTDALIDLGHEVYVIDNLSTGKKENINTKAVFIQRDIRDKAAVGSLPKLDYVFHTAALARIQRSIENPIETNDVNVNGTLNLLEYCRNTGAKIIFSGSSSIYKGDKLPAQEDDEKLCKNPYSLQKLIIEYYIELYGKLYDLDYTILRYFNVYGERQILSGAYAAVVGIFLDQRKKGQHLTITGDGEQRRDFTYIQDVVKANIMAMKWPRDSFNIGRGDNHSINEIANAVSGKIKHIAERPGEVRATLADNSKAKKQGWQPTKDILEWISEQG